MEIKEQCDIKNDVAIIGVGCRMPQANTLDMFWSNISNGVESIKEFPAIRERDTNLYLLMTHQKEKQVNYIKGAYLNRIDDFDYNFFSISPKEAQLMDPNQRLFLQTAFSAIEDAGYGGDKLKGSHTGVYFGYRNETIQGSYGQAISTFLPAYAGTSYVGNLPAIIPSRVSYVFDLRGPALSIDTACSSSLVALHYAYQDIINKECEYGLVGSSRICLLPTNGGTNIGIASEDGQVRTFDDSSSGTGFGEGVIAILLKSLDRAIEDGDHIYAVIKGSAINQDGMSLGITSPNVNAQTEVMIKCWEKAKINPETISYIEAHGTGTKIGDPMEIHAIKKAFEKYTNKKQICGIGSLKTNIGHLDNASGLAGILKLIGALQHHQIPPTLNFNRPNRKIKFENSPLYVSDRLTPWESTNLPRRCGINSFGLSGTNCHVVLEEAPNIYKKRRDDKKGQLQILTLSARSEMTLLEIINNYKKMFDTTLQQKKLSDICYTANTGRTHFNCRMAIIGSCIEEIRESLKTIQYIGDLKSDKLVHNNILYNRVKEKQKTIVAEEINQKLSVATAPLSRTMIYELAKEYCQGASINWNLLYKDDQYYRVSLPTYPFEKNKCWIQIKDRNKIGLCYKVNWKKYPFKKIYTMSRGTILVFKDDLGKGDQLIEELKKREYQVVEVSFANEFKCRNSYQYCIRNKYEDYCLLLQLVGCQSISTILHLSSIHKNNSLTVSALDTVLDKSTYSLFRLVKALEHENIKNTIEIILVANDVNRVQNDATICKPESAIVFGLGRVVGIEHKYLNCRAIDIDESTSIGNLADEIVFAKDQYQVAYRKNERYVEEINRVENTGKENAVKINTGGVYLITGGLGGIGLEISKFLASKKPVQLILLSRKKLPEKKLWKSILEENKEIAICKKICEIKNIEELGSQVACYSVDISNQELLTAVLDDVREKYGQINGIIHAAGIAGENFILNKTEDMFKSVMKPKVQGTWLLDQLTKDDNLDFFYLFSSITALTGGPGQSDYTAGNAYLDAFAAYRNQLHGTTLTIDWSGWEEVGMAKEHHYESNHSIFKSMKTQVAIEAFEEALNSQEERVIVGEIIPEKIGKLDESMFFINEELKQSLLYNDELENKEFIDNEHKKQLEEDKVGFNIKLTGSETQSYTELEQKIGNTFGNVLGFEQLDITNNFFEMGGNSISSIQLEAELEKYGINVTSNEIYQYPSIKELAKYIEDKEDDEIILSPIVPFTEVLYRNCFYNSFFPIVLYLNKNILEIICNDQCIYEYHEGKLQVSYKEIVPLEDVLKQQGIFWRVEQQIENSRNQIKNALRNGRPVIIWIDCYYESLRIDTYKKKHLAHTWLVYGFDEVKKEFIILEHKGEHDLSYSEQRVRYEELENAYEGFLTQFGNKMSEYSYYEFYTNKEENIETKKEQVISKGQLKVNETCIALFVEDSSKRLMQNPSKEEMWNIVENLNTLVNAKKIDLYISRKLCNKTAEKNLNESIAYWDKARFKLAKILYSNIKDNKIILQIIQDIKNGWNSISQ